MEENQDVISVQALKKRFGPIQAVNGVSLEVRQGEIFGFLGANGSGKTTMLRMLCGLLTPDSGKGQCLGFDLFKYSFALKQHIGYMTQKFSLYDELTVEENLSFVAKMYRVKTPNQKISDLLAQLNLLDRKKQLAGTLSGGLKQRLALGASLVHEPKLLLLDEPTAGVDPKSRGDFWNTIHNLSQQGITILLSTHYMDEAVRCTRLAYMSFGQILVQGKIQEIVEHAKLKTFEVQCSDLVGLSRKLRQNKDISQIILFGSSLHVSGKHTTAFDKAIESFRHEPNTQWKEVETNLEDVFINLIQKEQVE